MKKIAQLVKTSLSFVFQKLPHFSIYIVVTVLLLQFVGYASILSQYKDHQAIVEARDNDAGEMVKVAGRSTWYSDNSFRYYGPLYFRLASTMNAFVPVSDLYLQGYQGPEVKELSLHFHLLLLSLIGIFAMAFILAWNLVSSLSLRLSLSALIVYSLTAHPVWSQYLLTAHPDMALGAVCVLAMLLTYFVLVKKFSENSLKWAGAAWGLVLATKLSGLFLTPGVFFLFFPPWSKEGWQKFKVLFRWILIVYFLVGFPQNFDVVGSLSKLLRLSEFSAPFSWKEFFYWYELFASQSWRSLLVLLLFGFLLGRKKSELSKGQVWRFFLLSHLGMFLLSTRTILLTHDYYVIPFVAVGLLGWVVLISHYLPIQIVKSESWQHLIAIGVLLGVGQTSGLVHPQASQTLKEFYSCRNEHREVFNASLEYVKKGMKVRSTPYTPVTQNSELVSIDWEMTWSRVKELESQVIVTSQSYYSRFTDGNEPTDYVKKNNPGWQQQRDFFSGLEAAEVVSSQEYGTWKRVHKDACGLAIWEKVNN